MPMTVPNKPSKGAARGDGAQGAQVFLKPVGHCAAAAFHGGRRSASLHCGLFVSARAAAGQHLTQREFCASWFTHVGRGQRMDLTKR